MAVINSADVLAGLKPLWDSDRALAALVPGGLHHGRPGLTKDGQTVKAPYATLKVAEQAPQFNSSATYVQAFTLTLTVWSERGAADAGGILRALDLLFDRGAAPEAILVPGADKVLDLMPAPGDLALDEAMRKAADQVVGVRAWELLVQATRGR